MSVTYEQAQRRNAKTCKLNLYDIDAIDALARDTSEPRASVRDTAKAFGVSRRTIQRIRSGELLKGPRPL